MQKGSLPVHEEEAPPALAVVAQALRASGVELTPVGGGSAPDVQAEAPFAPFGEA